jgi:hypothetical protein
MANACPRKVFSKLCLGRVPLQLSERVRDYICLGTVALSALLTKSCSAHWDAQGSEKSSYKDVRCLVVVTCVTVNFPQPLNVFTCCGNQRQLSGPKIVEMTCEERGEREHGELGGA